MKAFIGKPIEGLPIVDVLHPNFGITESDHIGYYRVLVHEEIFHLVDRPEDADCLIFPHNLNSIKDNSSYIRSFEDISLRLKKKILVFFPGDSDEPVEIKNCIVFRNSQYKGKAARNEIMMPGYVSDLSISLDIAAIDKKRDIPVIGFCGWADFKTKIEYIKYALKTLVMRIRLFFGKGFDKTRIKGIWWRRKIINMLRGSRLCGTDFIIRKSYSGANRTMIGDPLKLRQEYIENILNSDLSLCIKGDGNFSTRFFEVLSLGKIPLFIDTDCILPLEDIIDYSSFMVRVDWKDIGLLDKIALDWYKGISDARFKEMQALSRRAFEEKLGFESFIKYVFESGYIDRYF